MSEYDGETIYTEEELKKQENSKTLKPPPFNIEIKQTIPGVWTATAFGSTGLGETIKSALDDWVDHIIDATVSAVDISQQMLDGSMPQIKDFADE